MYNVVVVVDVDVVFQINKYQFKLSTTCDASDADVDPRRKMTANNVDRWRQISRYDITMKTRRNKLFFINIDHIINKLSF